MGCIKLEILDQVRDSERAKPKLFSEVCQRKRVCAEKKGVSSYRYGFNGMEKDDEISGNGNSYTTQLRQYDPRLGKWLSLDPLMAKYPHQSSYAAFNNSPIYFADPTGLEGENPHDSDFLNSDTQNNQLGESEWVPVVTDEGEISYEAQEGDSAESLSKQYGIPLAEAETITDTEGSDKIEAGTSISGDKVCGVTCNSILKLNNLDPNTTNDDFANQLVFGLRNAEINIDLENQYMQFSDYFSDVPGTKGLNKIDLDATVQFGDSEIRVNINGNFSEKTSDHFLNYDASTGKLGLNPEQGSPFKASDRKYYRNFIWNQYNKKKGMYPLRVIAITFPAGHNFSEYVNP